MNVLEKILEEIDEERNGYEADHAWNYSKGLEYAKEIIRSHMDEVPDNDSGWIPVEERLPEEDERYKGRKVIDVLVTTAKGKVTKVQRQSHNDYWRWGRIYGEPTAWQPLPEAYHPKETPAAEHIMSRFTRVE